MATKYTASSPTRKWRYEGHPRITKHCADRWNERMPAAAASPEFAYLNSTEASGICGHPEFTSGETPTPGGIHVYRGETPDGEQYCAIFLEGGRDYSEDALVTVFSVDFINDPAVRAFLHATADKHPEGIVYE